jgi:carboxymethylenebutenolidase
MDTTEDGAYAATIVTPEAGSGPGIVLFQEIFGVNDFLLAKATDLAELGYVVLCPDVFWRIQPGATLTHDDAGLAEGFRLVQAYAETVPDDRKVADLTTAVEHLRGLPETSGPVAAMGYCLGGTLAYRTASHVEVDACVSYYGSGVADALAAGERPSCPTLFHFGGKDPFLPEEQVEAVIRGFADRPDVEVHVQPGAGHAFENFLNPQFSNLDAAAVSWPLTTEFLARVLPR